MMRRLLTLLTLLLPCLAFAEDAAEKKDEKKDAAEKTKEEKPKERAGTISLGGAEVKYLAQTGTIPVLKDDGGV